MIPENNTTGQLPYDLKIAPYGAEVFTDFTRGKSFVVLFYRHDGGPRAKVLSWIGDVLDDLTRAGIHVSDAVKPNLTPNQHKLEPVTPDTHYRCHLQVPVTSVDIEALRTRYAKP